MKKILFLAVFSVLIAGSTYCQSSLVSSIGNAADTITNTGTKYLYLPSAVKAKGFFKTVVATVKVATISGTMTGAATLEGSIDGTDYYPISKDTLSYSTTAPGYGWTINDWGHQFLRVKVTGSATQSTRITGKTLLKN